MTKSRRRKRAEGEKQWTAKQEKGEGATDLKGKHIKREVHEGAVEEERHEYKD